MFVVRALFKAKDIKQILYFVSNDFSFVTESQCKSDQKIFKNCPNFGNVTKTVAKKSKL